ncbi:MAG: cytochrome c biosis factor [Acidimicrobiaceae bacterium]|nr:cytochrome c biosis factor [Acidimicrobiaceae bacterium]
MSPSAPAGGGVQQGELAPGSDPASAGELSRLRGERDFLLTSLEDLERERAAGDVSEDDYATLRAAYVGRAAEAIRGIARLEEDRPFARPGSGVARPELVSGTVATGESRFRRALGRRRTRRLLGVVGLVCVLGIVAVAAAHFAGVRLPGQSATGTIGIPTAEAVRQDLSEASVLAGTGQVTQAVQLYDQVLSAVPHQPEALTYRGWLLRLSGIAVHDASATRQGDAQLAEAAQVAPGYPDARALDGLALLEDQHRLGAALSQFRASLSDRPSTVLLQAIGPKMAAAFVQAHQAVPAGLRPYVAKSAGG